MYINDITSARASIDTATLDFGTNATGCTLGPLGNHVHAISEAIITAA